MHCGRLPVNGGDVHSEQAHPLLECGYALMTMTIPRRRSLPDIGNARSLTVDAGLRLSRLPQAPSVASGKAA